MSAIVYSENSHPVTSREGTREPERARDCSRSGVSEPYAPALPTERTRAPPDASEVVRPRRPTQLYFETPSGRAVFSRIFRLNSSYLYSCCKKHTQVDFLSVFRTLLRYFLTDSTRTIIINKEVFEAQKKSIVFRDINSNCSISFSSSNCLILLHVYVLKQLSCNSQIINKSVTYSPTINRSTYAISIIERKTKRLKNPR